MPDTPVIVPGSGSCWVSPSVLDGVTLVGRVVREPSSGPADNGWRVLSEADGRAWPRPGRLMSARFDTVCVAEPAVIGVYDFDVGTDITLDRSTGRIRYVDTASGRVIPEENLYVPPAHRETSPATAPVPGAAAGARPVRQPARAGGACILSRNVLEGRGRIKFAVRQQPANPADNGWRVFSEFDSDEFVADSRNMAVVAWETVCGYEPAMELAADLPLGSDVEVHHVAGGPSRLWLVGEERYLDPPGQAR